MTQSETTVFGLRHFPLDRISRFCAETWSIKADERAALAHHLSTGCRRCWSAVGDIAPGSVGRSYDPVAEALYRVCTPQSRATLRADHLAAVEDVRRRPFGFAFLLLEEAFSLALECETAIPLESDAFKLIGALQPGRHHERHDDLYATALAYLSIVRTSRGETDAAHVAWGMAERHRMLGTGDHRINAGVLEARGLLAAAASDPQVAETFLSVAIERLGAGPEHVLRRFELYGRLADVAIDAGKLGEVPAILARANHLLASARLSADPLSQAQAVYRWARLTAHLAGRMESQSGLLATALHWAAAELEDAAELFAAATDFPTQTLRLVCLARLHSFFDSEKAARFREEAMRHLDAPLDDERFGLFRVWENPELGDEPFATLSDRETALLAGVDRHFLEAAGAAALEQVGKILVRRR